MTKGLWVLLFSLLLSSCQEHTMNKIGQPYTLGHWTAKAGNEKALISEWQAFAKWTKKNQKGSGTGLLLQDPQHPQRFVSFGPWEDANAIKAWRESLEFKTFASKVKDLCEDFQPGSFLLVATSDE